MAFIKYSVGPITSVKDVDSVEKKEDSVPESVDKATLMLICKTCGIQHMLYKNEPRACCGNLIKADKLS